MKSSLIILAFFVAGILAGVFRWLPAALTHPETAMYAVYLLLFLVGLVVGGNPDTWAILRRVNVKILLVPLATMIGTFVGVTAVSFLIAMPLRHAWAVGAGFGYYSLSSILITQLSGQTLGVIALLSNIMREMFTLILTPLLVRYFGKLAPIATGAATTMDTTLPIITRHAGPEYAVIAVFSALCLTITVPLLVTFLLG